MRVWITTYALTTGIFVAEVEPARWGDPRAIHRRASPGVLSAYYHKPNWHETREEAIRRAEEMRERKLASLRRAMAKLEALDFEKATP